MPVRRVTLTLLLFTLAPLPASAQADTPIAALSGPTPVRAWDGTAVLSVRDAGTGWYRLALVRGSAAPELIPGIAPARSPFDADIGPGPSGTAVIVYSRCPRKGPCRLVRTTPAGGAERAITGAASTGGSESAPTVWGTRLAFARTYARGSAQVAGPRSSVHLL